MINKDYIRIQSSINIRVAGSLAGLDLTNPKELVPNKLRAVPLWTKEIVHIKKGVNIYPAVIKNWPVIQALVKDRLLTISEVDDKDLEDIDNVTKVNETAKKLKDAENERLAKLEALKKAKEATKLPNVGE